MLSASQMALISGETPKSSPGMLSGVPLRALSLSESTPKTTLRSDAPGTLSGNIFDTPEPAVRIGLLQGVSSRPSQKSPFPEGPDRHLENQETQAKGPSSSDILRFA